MKRMISIFVLATVPVFAVAGGGHTMEHHDHASPAMSNMVDDDAHETEAGQQGDPAKVTQTIKVLMSDNMRFTPDKLNFKTGETVRFVVQNNGKIRHEMVIGTEAELNEHADMMRNMPTMKRHAESNMISLAPGEQGELVWQFGPSGTLDFACLVPGHREAGMMGSIKVSRGASH